MTADEDTLQLYTLFKSLLKKSTELWKRRNGDLMPLSHFSMLYIIHSQGRQRVAELAEKLSVTPGAITGMSDKLITLGLVDRLRDETDRRVVFLSLTEQGKTLIDSMFASRLEIYSVIVKQLPEEDIEHLTRIFTQMIQFIDTEEERN
ncbi:MarR family transcriptional regulator [Paenibacillaceae bacterium]|nr:MarR family transcriptional regulator [Paenibacillaceae bacterium]